MLGELSSFEKENITSSSAEKERLRVWFPKYKLIIWFFSIQIDGLLQIEGILRSLFVIHSGYKAYHF